MSCSSPDPCTQNGRGYQSRIPSLYLLFLYAGTLNENMSFSFFSQSPPCQESRKRVFFLSLNKMAALLLK
jgi:hypothetical protein